MKDNNITCPSCNHEFSLGDLQQKLVEEKATAMNKKWQKEQNEMMEIEKKKELMEALEKAILKGIIIINITQHFDYFIIIDKIYS